MAEDESTLTEAPRAASPSRRAARKAARLLLMAFAALGAAAAAIFKEARGGAATLWSQRGRVIDPVTARAKKIARWRPEPRRYDNALDPALGRAISPDAEEGAPAAPAPINLFADDETSLVAPPREVKAAKGKALARRRAEPPVETAIAGEDVETLVAAPLPPEKPPAPQGHSLRTLLVELAAASGSLAFAGVIALLFVAFVLLAPRAPTGADLWGVNRQASIVILDSNGEEIAQRGARYGEAVTVEDLPPYLVKAFLSTEDRRFYEHGGVDLRGTLRAFMTNLREGEVVEGGSTITQQLARNLFLSFEQTYIRKAREALLALWIEGRYAKDEILSLYLNRVYFGAGAYGVESAAKTYFGKSARDVTLSEAVMLAGLLKAPSTLAPTQNPFGAQKRADDVLQNLLETGAVTEFEARLAKANPPVITGSKSDPDLGYIFDYVAAKAKELARGRDGDLIIQTTIDAKMQRDAEAAVKSVISTEAKLVGAEQAALVAYDANGALRAMVGGVSYVESQFNRAAQAKRQPGSAFKPFVYVAALEAGLTPQSAFVDQPIKIENWEPKNYTNEYHGRMRITEAVAKSVNTVAVQASEFAGRERVVEAAHRLGLQSDIQAVPSIALGGASMSLEELVGAYIPFARGGSRVETYVIERIEDQNLEVIYQRRDEEPVQVIEPTVARDITHLLYQVMHSGTGASARLEGRIAAGKTGTTNDWRDAWFVGYTAQIVAGVWVGNDAYTPMERVTGGTLPAEIWKNFMLAAHQGLPRRDLAGAYPAPQYQDEQELLSFYASMAQGFRDVRRDGRERRYRRDWN